MERNTMEELNMEELDTENGTLISYYNSDREMVYLAAILPCPHITMCHILPRPLTKK